MCEQEYSLQLLITASDSFFPSCQKFQASNQDTETTLR